MQGGAQEFRLFWAGPRLSPYEELGLLSLVARRQRVFLFSYDRSLQVPQGVELVDANEILPARQIHQFTFPNGETAPSPHANLFRYEALKQFGGWYCDLDVVLAHDAPPGVDVSFAHEDEHTINNAILRFPANAPLMAAAAGAARNLMSGDEWGASGPKLLTRLVREMNLGKLARPADAAYPVRTTEVMQLFLCEHREELETRAAKADFVHLWNQIWRRVRIPKELGPPQGSFLDALFRRFDIRVPPSGRMTEQAIRSWFHEYFVLLDARRANEGNLPVADVARRLGPARVESEPARADPAQLADIRAELERARWQRDQLLESTSWRATAPLRAISQRLRQLIGKE